MSNDKQKVKTIFIDGKETDVTFYNEITNQRLLSFIDDVEYFYLVLEDIDSTYVQQFTHAILIIKHFTDYKINLRNADDFLKESKKFIMPGVLESFSSNFEKGFIEEINKFVVIYFLLSYGKIPNYLDIGNNSKSVEEIKQVFKKYKEIFEDDWDLLETDIDDIDIDDIVNYEEEFKPVFKIAWNIQDQEELQKNLQSIDKADINVKVLKEAIEDSIDKLLDEYNDYMDLYKMFGDKKYKDRAKHILKVLEGEEDYRENKFLD